MKRASNIILLVSAIESIIVAVTFAIVGIVFLALNNDATKEAMMNTASTSSQTSEETINIVLLTYTILGVIFLILTAFAIASCIVCFIARNKETKGLYIACIVLGALSSELPIAGGVFGLIALKRENKVIANE